MNNNIVHFRGPWNHEIVCGADATTVKSTFKKEKVTCEKCREIMYDIIEEAED